MSSIMCTFEIHLFVKSEVKKFANLSRLNNKLHILFRGQFSIEQCYYKCSYRFMFGPEKLNS